MASTDKKSVLIGRLYGLFFFRLYSCGTPVHNFPLSIISFFFQNGFILVDNSTLEIKPLNKRLSAFLKYREALISDSIDSIPFVPHLIKRSYSFLPSYENLPWNDLEDFDTDTHRVEITPVGDPIWTNNLIKRGSQRLTIEIAVFFDAAAYKLFSPYMGYNDRHMRDMLLAYINGVSTIPGFNIFQIEDSIADVVSDQLA